MGGTNVHHINVLGIFESLRSPLSKFTWIYLVCEDFVVGTISLDAFVASGMSVDEFLSFGCTSRADGDGLVNDICDTSTLILFSVKRIDMQAWGDSRLWI